MRSSPSPRTNARPPATQPPTPNSSPSARPRTPWAAGASRAAPSTPPSNPARCAPAPPTPPASTASPTPPPTPTTATRLAATLEPGPMCAGAAHAARLDRLVYAAPDPKAGYAGTLHDVTRDPRLNHTLAVQSGLLEREAAELLRSFFKDRRKRPAKPQESG